MAGNTSGSRSLLIVLGLLLAGILVYGVMNMPDRRTGAERVGDAISELPNGVDRAADQLGDRTPADRAEEAVKDTGEAISNSVDRQ